MDSWEKMYSVKEAAAILGRSNDTVRRLISRGFLKAILLPWQRQPRRGVRTYKSWVIPASEIKRFMMCNQS